MKVLVTVALFFGVLSASASADCNFAIKSNKNGNGVITKAMKELGYKYVVNHHDAQYIVNLNYVSIAEVRRLDFALSSTDTRVLISRLSTYQEIIPGYYPKRKLAKQILSYVPRCSNL